MVNKQKCPHCGKRDCIPTVVEYNVEFYDNNTHHVHCTKCGKMIRVYAERTVVVHSIDPSDHTESDYDGDGDNRT